VHLFRSPHPGLSSPCEVDVKIFVLSSLQCAPSFFQEFRCLFLFSLGFFWSAALTIKPPSRRLFAAFGAEDFLFLPNGAVEQRTLEPLPAALFLPLSTPSSCPCFHCPPIPPSPLIRPPPPNDDPSFTCSSIEDLAEEASFILHLPPQQGAFRVLFFFLLFPEFTSVPSHRGCGLPPSFEVHYRSGDILYLMIESLRASGSSTPSSFFFPMRLYNYFLAVGRTAPPKTT